MHSLHIFNTSLLQYCAFFLLNSHLVILQHIESYVHVYDSFAGIICLFIDVIHSARINNQQIPFPE